MQTAVSDLKVRINSTFPLVKKMLTGAPRRKTAEVSVEYSQPKLSSLNVTVLVDSWVDGAPTSTSARLFRHECLCPCVLNIHTAFSLDA